MVAGRRKRAPDSESQFGVIEITSAERYPLRSFLEKKQTRSMSQEAQIAERSANSESYHLSRSVFCVATSLFSRESTGKTAALQRSIFGRWLTPGDDAEHKPAQNEVCASSHKRGARSISPEMTR